MILRGNEEWQEYVYTTLLKNILGTMNRQLKISIWKSKIRSFSFWSAHPVAGNPQRCV